MSIKGSNKAEHTVHSYAAGVGAKEQGFHSTIGPWGPEKSKGKGQRGKAQLIGTGGPILSNANA